MQHASYYQSPFGCFKIISGLRGIRSVQLTDDPPSPIPTPSDPLAIECIRQMKAYFAKERRDFDLQLDWDGAPTFHQQVWEELQKIPYGHMTSYSAIASNLGDANKMRAVGQANKNNPIAIIVPCHRVIAKSGDLQGYFYGVDMKRRLLELENPMSYGQQGSLF